MLQEKNSPGAQNSLDALCKRFKIDNSRRQKHSALLDCELLAKVYIELFEKKEPSLQFNMDNDEPVVQNVKILKNREQLIQEITLEENELHKKFLKKDLPKSFNAQLANCCLYNSFKINGFIKIKTFKSRFLKQRGNNIFPIYSKFSLGIDTQYSFSLLHQVSFLDQLI